MQPSPFTPPDPKTQLFPVLTSQQIDRMRSCGRVRPVSAGETLFEADQTGASFFVVLSGQLDITQANFDGEHLLASHGPGQFTGEITMISGQRSLARGRMSQAGEVLELEGEALRALVGRDGELSEILLRAFILRRLELINRGSGTVILMGSRHSAATLALREFLGRNAYPYTYVDLDTDSNSQELLDRFHIEAHDVPVVICHSQTVLRNPSPGELARCLGFNSSVDGTHVRDVIVIGAGPAGLAAAVYAASEGLDVLVVETIAPGGQAGSSSKIENYLGFPMGVSGQELSARAATQAQKFGAQFMIAQNVVALDSSQHPYRVLLEDGTQLHARAIVIATGAQYKKLPLENLARFEGNGVYYGATYIESQLCGADEVAVVGGGNSAGQAAAFLSQTARLVHMLVRSDELKSTMSRYLIQRLTENPKIDLHVNTEIVGLAGGDHLEEITWRDKTNGTSKTSRIPHLFLMTGASPRTGWLRGSLALDDKGFILTGRDVEGANGDTNTWKLQRPPQMLETSLPGVFAVGDARAGNVKRVASAVGEGAISIHMVHRTLAEL